MAKDVPVRCHRPVWAVAESLHHLVAVPDAVCGDALVHAAIMPDIATRSTTAPVGKDSVPLVPLPRR